jgi:cold shock CspA family protein
VIVSSKISEVPTHSVDSWRIWDFPVLRAVAAWDEANLESHYLDVVELTKRMQRPHSDQARVAKAVRRLDDAGFLEVQFPAASLPLEFMISRLTPVGRQVCGSWPSSDELAPVIIAALEAKAVDVARIRIHHRRGWQGLFFNDSGLVDCEIDELNRGDIVTFDLAPTRPKGPRAANVQRMAA